MQKPTTHTSISPIMAAMIAIHVVMAPGADEGAVMAARMSACRNACMQGCKLSAWYVTILMQ